MKYSQRQIEVWRAREKLDRRLAKMTPDEVLRFSEQVLPDLEKKLGRKLNLRVANLPAAQRKTKKSA